MRKIIVLLICALLVMGALPTFAESSFNYFYSGYSEERPEDPNPRDDTTTGGEEFAIDVNGETVRLAFDASPLYSSAQGGMVQASYYAYGQDGVTLYELYINFPETARPGMVITPEYEAMINGNSSVSLIVSSGPLNQKYYFSSLADGAVYPEGSSFSIAIDDIADGNGVTAYSGRLSAKLILLDMVSGEAADALDIPETPFRFTLGGSSKSEHAPMSTAAPDDMRKV